MSVEKRQLLIEVEAGKIVCGDCDWLSRDGSGCEMFGESLDDDCVRCAKCLKAEEKARNLTAGGVELPRG